MVEMTVVNVGGDLRDHLRALDIYVSFRKILVVFSILEQIPAGICDSILRHLSPFHIKRGIVFPSFYGIYDKITARPQCNSPSHEPSI